MAEARVEGMKLPDAAGIEAVVALWHKPIPGNWQRGDHARLMGKRYSRGDADKSPGSEHGIELAVLTGPTRCFGGELVDGVTALPLARDDQGKRGGNVEADM